MYVAVAGTVSLCPVAHADSPAAWCRPQPQAVSGAVLPLPSTLTPVAAAPAVSSIPGAVVVASTPGNNLTPLGGRYLAPDRADPQMYMFNWKYPPHGVGPTTYPNPRGWAVQLNIVGATGIEFEVYAREKPAWNLSVDGVSTSPVPATDPAASEGRYLIRYALPDAGPHQLRFFMNNLSLGRVFADPGASATAWPADPPRVFFLGDSLTQGGAQSTGGELASWIWSFSAMCGFSDVWNGGIGGTGAINTGPDGLWANYLTRTATDVVPALPDIVFISSYYGDRTYPPDQIAETYALMFQRLRTLPSPPTVIVTGTYDPLGRNGAPYADIDRALAQTCREYGVPFIEPRTGNVYSAAGELVVPAGQTGPWITPENKDRYIGADHIHQTDEGQAYMAVRMYEAFRALP